MKPGLSRPAPATLGEHLRHHRRRLGLRQRDAADRLGVNVWTLVNWEKGHTQPAIRCWPAILAFLGYDPVPVGDSVAERILAVRRREGLSQQELAARLGVDPGTLSGWEGGRAPRAEHLTRIDRVVGIAEN